MFRPTSPPRAQFVEIVFAATGAVVVMAGCFVYLKRFAHAIERDRAFEAWVQSGPVVLAAHGPGADGIERVWRARLAELQTIANPHGRRPWPHYRLRARVERRSDDVVAVVLTGCALERGEGGGGASLLSLCAPLGGHEAEVWLHGQVHPEKRHGSVDRNRVGWVGAVDARGALTVREMIGEPAWLSGDARPTPLTPRASKLG